MKKILSVILAAVMLMGCLSVMAFASVVTLTTGENPDDGTPLVYENDTVVIPNGATYTNYGAINMTGGSFTVEKGGTFQNYGTITFADTAVTVNGAYNNWVSLPANRTVTYDRTDPTFDRADHTVTYTYRSLLKSEMTDEGDYLNVEKYRSRTSVPVPRNDTLYIMVVAEEGAGKYPSYLDTSRVRLSSGGNIVDSTAADSSRRGIFAVKPDNYASYSAVSLKYSDVVTQFVVELPSKKDVYTVATDEDETGSVLVNYGQMLTVHVILHPDYDESQPTLFIDTVEISPDEYGYFDINTVFADDQKTLIVNSINGKVYQNDQEISNYGVRAPFRINVLGCVKNETKQKFTSVLTYLKQIFAVFQEIFEELRAAFSGLFG